MGSAGVILGLTPSLLSFMGPTIPELSVLTLERPLLSALLAFGGPAMWPARGFEQHIPLKATRTVPKLPPLIQSVWWVRYAISAVEYVFAIAAAANVIILCLELGWKTVVTWEKRTPYLPLAWVLLSLFVHVVAALRLRLVRVVCTHADLWQVIADLPTKSLSDGTEKALCRRRAKSSWISLRDLLVAEIRLCCLRSRQDHVSQQEDQETFFWYNCAIVLSTICTMHQVFGIVIFSSLLFIGVEDIIPVIIRFGVSALVAQYIRVFEISGLLAVFDQSCQDGAQSFDRLRDSRGEKDLPHPKIPSKTNKIGDVSVTTPPRLPSASSTVCEHPSRESRDGQREDSEGNSTQRQTDEGRRMGFDIERIRE